MKFLNKENEWVDIETANEGELNENTLIQIDMKELNEIINDEIESVENDMSVKLDISNVLSSKLNKIGFELGVSKASEVCGIISALKSVGLDSSQALEYILNERTIQYNTELNIQNNKTLLENTKLQSVKLENTQL